MSDATTTAKALHLRMLERVAQQQRIDRLAYCGVPGCDGVAERVCVSCNGHRCSEHAHFSESADEYFCDLTDEGSRFWRSDLNYHDKPERGAT